MSVQPELGQRLEQARLKHKNGKKMGRKPFGELLGITAGRVLKIEEGAEVTDDELKRILEVVPEVGAAAWSTLDEVMARYPVDPELQARARAELEAELAAYDVMPITEEEYAESFLHSGDDVRERKQPVTSTETSPSRERRELPLLQISNSEARTFKRCRRKWYLAWYRGIRPIVEEVTGARAIGTRVHNALKSWYVPEGETPEDPRDALERFITDDWTTLVQQHNAYGLSVPHDTIEKFKADTGLERIMVEGYLEWLKETGVDRGLIVIAPEQKLEQYLTTVNGVDVNIIGKLDARVYREIDGVRMFIDHKTVGSINEKIPGLRQDEQMLHYHLLEWLDEAESSRCDGAFYNMLRKVKRTARATPPFYERVEVPHNDYELEAYRTHLIGTIYDIIKARQVLDAGNGISHHEVAYPNRTDDCRWDCDFNHICPLFDDGSRADDMLDEHFVQGNPLDRYDNDEEK